MDYQQYKSGDRLEGFMEQSGLLLGSFFGLGTGCVIPLIFLHGLALVLADEEITSGLNSLYELTQAYNNETDEKKKANLAIAFDEL